jgi:hypothetical protein
MSEHEVENGEEEIDETGRNLTQQRIDEEAADDDATEGGSTP